MNKTTTAGFYIIKQDEDGNVLLFLPAYIGSKNDPLIIYDGGDHAIFARNEELSIILDYINPEIRNILKETAKITVVEAEGQNIIDNYKVSIKHVDKIPLQWSKYGLKSWEEAADTVQGIKK